MAMKKLINNIINIVFDIIAEKNKKYFYRSNLNKLKLKQN